MESTAVRLVAQYNDVAETWGNTVARLWFTRAYRGLFRRLLRAGVLPRGGRVLDAGIGSGSFSTALLSSGVRPDDIHGIDIASGMLDQASRTLQAHGIPFFPRIGSINELPYPPDAFDLVIASHVVEHAGNPARAIGEFERVLKPGGMLVVVATRPGAWGRRIARKWNATPISAHGLRSLLAMAGLECYGSIRFGAVGLPAIGSVAAVGRAATRRPHPRRNATTFSVTMTAAFIAAA